MIRAIVASILLLCSNAYAAEISFAKAHDAFKTKLLTIGPSPQAYEEEAMPEGVTEIKYPSKGLSLKAWLYRGDSEQQRKRPVLVYFHGGFSFGASDLNDCRRFMDAGFIVLAPMLRGENGNDGSFEMCMGEVDDACAAIRWISEQDFVERDHIYTFGHSAGGIISTLVALIDDVPVRITGSSGGLYGPKYYLSSKIAPFDKSNPEELKLRSIVGNVSALKHRHFAYAGSQDSWQEVSEVKKELSAASKLCLEVVAGSHFSSLPASFDRYLKIVLDDIHDSK